MKSSATSLLLASGWKAADIKIAGSSNMQSVFVLTDEITGTKGKNLPDFCNLLIMPGAHNPFANHAAETVV